MMQVDKGACPLVKCQRADDKTNWCTRISVAYIIQQLIQDNEAVRTLKNWCDYNTYDIVFNVNLIHSETYTFYSRWCEMEMM